MPRKVQRARYSDGSEVEVCEDDRRRLSDGRVQVSGTWVVRGPAAGRHRRAHTRSRPRRS